MTSRDISDLTPEQQELYLTIHRLANERDNPKVPLTEIETELNLDRSGLTDLLTEPMLDRFLDYREDKPNSPGWLAIDEISGAN